ncbi:MAG: Swt1 family HEPN domain-containing protein [Acidimicrobiia bacterium]|nr:Swt1 family HEPN domain-containing protein [Acidimicrobiia bacterium]
MAQAFEIMAGTLGPFIDDRMAVYFENEPSWSEAAANRLGRPAEHGATDPLFQLLVLRRFWGPVFADFFGQDLRSLVGELIETRNWWAHFSLPDEIDLLDRTILGVERLLAPIEPEATSNLRRLRSRLHHPKSGSVSSAGASRGDEDSGPAAEENPSTVDITLLEAQLSETESVFQDLQSRYGDLVTELDRSRRIAASKHLRLVELERQLIEIEGRTLAAETFLVEERTTRYRIEWLFVGLLATLLLFMVLANT